MQPVEQQPGRAARTAGVALLALSSCIGTMGAAPAAPSPAAADTGRPGTFRVISTTSEAELARTLGEAQGWRFAGLSRRGTESGEDRLTMLLQRREDGAPAAPQMRFSDWSFSLPAFQVEMNSLARQGYRLAADGLFARFRFTDSRPAHSQILAVLEPDGTTPPCEYRLVSLRRPSHAARELDPLGRAGFELVAVVGVHGSLIACMERRIPPLVTSAQAAAATSGPSPLQASSFKRRARRHLTLVDASDRAMQRRLQEAAAEGWRLVALPTLGLSPGSRTAILVNPPAGTGLFDYRFLWAGTATAGELQKGLDEAGGLGFRIMPATLRSKTTTLEKAPGESDTWTHRVVAHDDPEDLARDLGQLEAQGYELVGLTGEQMVVMARRSPAAR